MAWSMLFCYVAWEILIATYVYDRLYVYKDMMIMTAYLFYVRDVLWSAVIPAIVLSGGCYLCAGFGMRPFRWLMRAVISLGEKKHSHGITAFQSLATLLSGTVGTGTIAGVAVAIKIGGPGVLFYIWVVALLGMIIKYAEALLALHYRQIDDAGMYYGGPMYYIRDVLSSSPRFARFLSIFYACACMASALGIGACVQSHSIATALYTTYAITPMYTGMMLMFLALVVIYGGVRSVVVVAECIVPCMIIIYVGMCLIVLYDNASNIPRVLYHIYESAIYGYASPSLWSGIGMGVVIQQGVSRSIFTHEAGLGSSAFAQAVTDTDNPLRQAGISMLSTIIDTFIMCTLTGLVIILASDMQIEHTGVALTMQALATCIPYTGMIISMCAVLFGMTTIFTWGYYGQSAAAFIHHKLPLYFIGLWLCAIGYGATQHSDIVWAYADLANASMMIPNMLVVVMARPMLIAWLKRS